MFGSITQLINYEQRVACRVPVSFVCHASQLFGITITRGVDERVEQSMERRARDNMVQATQPFQTSTPAKCSAKSSTSPKTSRKCSFCQKRMYFKIYQCRYCRHRFHEKCALVCHTHCKRRCETGDDHWSKLLQANEINANNLILQNWTLCSDHLQKRTKPQGSKIDKDNALSRLCNRLRKLVTSKGKTSSFHDNQEAGEEVIQPLPSPLSSVSSVSTDVTSSSTFTSVSSLAPSSPLSDDRTSTLSFPPVPSPGLYNYHANLSGTFSCPPKARHNTDSPALEPTAIELLCATWPPTGRKLYNLEEDFEDSDDSVFWEYEDTEERLTNDWSEVKESLGDCSINYEDLQKGECLRVGRVQKIYRGQWHGDVIINEFIETAESKFWEKVSTLGMIRHENIALFMGACMELPNFAIVTSIRRAQSLYAHVHIHQEKMTLQAKVHIARQISQGMGYLHAKGVVLEKLNSKNIFLESKVKICMVDQGMAEARCDRSDYACIPKNHLSYVAPELMTTLKVNGACLDHEGAYTKETDVYAFGSVLYELLCGKFPFADSPTHAVIWQVGSGKHQSTKHLKCPMPLKHLIEDCWGREPLDRPDFRYITEELQHNASLRKRHSSSVPDSLHKLGSAFQYL